MPIVLVRNLLKLAFSIFLFSVCSVAFAQPGENVESLQRQLRDIQNRLAEAQNRDDTFGKRVRSVGRQRTPKPEVIVEDVLTIRFYDLSDVFSVAPQYPAQVSTDFNARTNLLFPIAGNSQGGQFSGGGFGGGGGWSFQRTTITATTTATNQCSIRKGKRRKSCRCCETNRIA